MEPLRAAIVLASLVLGVCSCDEALGGEAVCTEIGCRDGVSLRAETESGKLVEGTYSISLQVDGRTRVLCSLDATDLSPSAQPRYLTATCDASDVRVNLSPQMVCTEHRTEDAVGQSCQPVEGSWELQLGVPGTPASVRVDITRDGVVLAEHTWSLDYVEVRPNGADCEPVCRQASPPPLVFREA